MAKKLSPEEKQQRDWKNVGIQVVFECKNKKCKASPHEYYDISSFKQITCRCGSVLLLNNDKKDNSTTTEHLINKNINIMYER